MDNNKELLDALEDAHTNEEVNKVFEKFNRMPIYYVLKKDAPHTSTQDLYGEFFAYSYNVEPEQFLKNTEDIEQVNNARKVLEKYFMSILSNVTLELIVKE